MAEVTQEQITRAEADEKLAGQTTAMITDERTARSDPGSVGPLSFRPFSVSGSNISADDSPESQTIAAALEAHGKRISELEAIAAHVSAVHSIQSSIDVLGAQLGSLQTLVTTIQARIDAGRL